ncbi:TRAP transporter small permease [Cellulomonas carbonis]|uniref:C4-dicarboxylate ABC transporter permease n=1 Tax=Cellulomonas carbonis T26 TaxID=947969 RepID=A0A0A0BQB8_9CELL|nr:TRAP transporter small permease [Cellulomonas carbonis]KGM10150.1 C4-dicarboxylate ABC transporter permease [Cellulomonas carbonis T26]GGC08588.1 C4-dicarboxylate ABC transporter permease [Cellulomonas carbonis]
MNLVKNALDRVLTWACVALFALLVVDVAWQVFARQVLDQPSGWSEELAKYLFIWLGLFGAALVFGERGHIAVDVLAKKLPVMVQRTLAVVVQLAVLTFTGLALVWGGLRVVDLAWEQNLTGLPVNVGPLYLALPISGVLIAFYTVYHLLKLFTGEETAAVDDAEPDVI